MLKSIGAVFAGIFTNFIIAVPIDAILHAVGVFPPMGEPTPDSLLVLAFSYRLIAAILGGYVTARLAPKNPMKHALVLGGIGVCLSTAGTIAMWSLGSHWYPLLLIVISIPCSWFGAKIKMERSA